SPRALSALDAVATETPASRATSDSVGDCDRRRPIRNLSKPFSSESHCTSAKPRVPRSSALPTCNTRGLLPKRFSALTLATQQRPNVSWTTQREEAGMTMTARVADLTGGRPVVPSRGVLRPLGLAEVRIVDGFWAQRQQTIATGAIDHARSWMQRLGWIGN